MSVRVERDGKTVVIDNFSAEFLGATAPGEYPPVGQTYKQFVCTVTCERGILVFCDSLINGRTRPHYYLYEFYRERGKLLVVNKVCRAPKTFFEGDDWGFAVRFRNTFYVTRAAGSFASAGVSKIVDVMELFRYVDGRISLADLDRHARHVERHKAYVARYNDLAAQLAAHKASSDARQRELQRELVHYRSATDIFVGLLTELLDLIKKHPFLGRLLYGKERARRLVMLLASWKEQAALVDAKQE